MAKAKRPSRSKAATAARADKANAANKVEQPAGSGQVHGGGESPLPVEDRLKSPEQERLENNPTGTRVDGTTARHTEPLGPGAPGQRGVPGPERRVVPTSGLGAPPPARTSGKDGQVFDTDTEEGMQAYKESLGPVIRVRAKSMGFVDNVRRRAGDVFDVREGEFSARWMARVDGTTPKKATTSKQALRAQNTEDLANRHNEVAADKAAGRTPAARSTGDREVGD